jgi:hypothetical protein
VAAVLAVEGATAAALALAPGEGLHLFQSYHQNLHFQLGLLKHHGLISVLSQYNLREQMYAPLASYP